MRRDEPKQYIASEAHRAYLEDKALEALEAEAAAEEEDEEEDYGDEEGGDEEAEGEGEEDYGEEYGEEDPDVLDPLAIKHSYRLNSPFLNAGETIDDRFN